MSMDTAYVGFPHGAANAIRELVAQDLTLNMLPMSHPDYQETYREALRGWGRVLSEMASECRGNADSDYLFNMPTA